MSVPKGGGAIRGIDEKFSVNPATGTGSLSVPVFTSPSRQDFFPRLSLSYDSGAGNGPFGPGWSLSVPSIARKTDKGLPRYQDDTDPDTFILSGAEDLVPVLVPRGAAWENDALERTLNGETYTVRRYRPRIEGLFARIERWQHRTSGDVHWRSVTQDNVTSIYGLSAGCRIADPDDATRVFSWLLEETTDDKGNVIRYEYKPENPDQVDPSQPQEKNRLTHTYAHRYLKRIWYGNPQPDAREGWLFEVVFDYGEHDLANPALDEAQVWPIRPDAFSSFRAGFEIRTQRLCRRTLMFHHFEELGAAPCLVRSTDFRYAESPVASYLMAVTQTGYQRAEQSDAYDTKSLPPLEFTYSQVAIDETIHFVDAESLEHLPNGLGDGRYQWIDLEGEGLSGILTEQGEGWFYKRSLGDGRFAPAQLVTTQPSLADLHSGRQQIMDLAGDGQQDLVLLGMVVSGFYERQEDRWQSFIPFQSSPNVAWGDPNLRLIDLNGDGHADILVSEEDAWLWYPSQAEAGFGASECVRKFDDEEQGPTLVFADASQSIYLADMTGDGLVDIARIRNGEVCYWPNLGYGRFGAKVTMANAPVFDYADQFEQQRVRLADIDGSGTTDILYLSTDGVKIWFNQAGNSWSAVRLLATFPVVVDPASVAVVDLLGNGTACLVWSSPLPADAHQPMRYIDLMGGAKPHLLIAIRNNMGLERTLHYASSTRFYLDDRAADKPWITKLPFPVHVLERIEIVDAIAETTLVSRYGYHHGYYDGQEREFRGFGLVEQWDAESFAGDANGDTLDLPPVYTRMWFHTGAYVDGQHIAQQFGEEYYAGDAGAALLPDTALPAGLNAEEERQACRALKGHVLRQEVYAEDGAPESAHPYQVAEYAYRLKQLQPMADQPHAVFYAYQSESLTYAYERNPADPRLSHSLTLAIDAFGHVTQSAAVAYPRRSAGAHPEQSRLLITCNEADFVNLAGDPAFYRVGVSVETRSYELTGVPHTPGVPFTIEALLDAAQAAVEIPYEASPAPGGLRKRLISRARTLYYRNDLSGPLPLGQVESRAMVYEQSQQALTPGLITQVYGARVDATLLGGDGGYRFEDDAWWVPSGRQVFDAAAFYLPVQVIDPFGNASTLAYDGYRLLIAQTQDPLGNTVTVQNDYRTMQPARVIDANGNRTAVAFDALGFVVATAVMGKDGEGDPAKMGDTLDDPTTRLEYSLTEWLDHGRPNFVRTLARERHGSDNPRWQECYTFIDGSGREAMTKVQAEPGPAPARDPATGQVIIVNGAVQLAHTESRWVGTGRTLYDNKGNPVKKYEPFFSDMPAFETERELVEWGVTPILHYDPLGRLIRADLPNGTFSQIVFDAWRQITYDENDTVLDSQWYRDRQSLNANHPDRRAAQLAAAHADTPAVAHLDVLGRVFSTVADNGPAGQYETHTDLDIQGNPLVVTDARGNAMMRYAYNLLNQPLRSVSVDAGERWMLNNVVGSAIRRWDDRGFTRRWTYDVLQRPTHVFVQGDSAPEILAERAIYGEAHPDALRLNMRGRVYQQFDSAGVATSDEYDFKGNLLRSRRQLAIAYRATVDWSPLFSLTDVADIAAGSAPLLESETFTQSTAYDALNRPISLIAPDASEIRPTYNEANLLEQVAARLRGAATWTPFVADIDYNAKGQREFIAYGNGVSTTYAYDPFTFRLTRLTTTRAADSAVLQDLSYTFDPVGNISQIQDDAQQTVFFNNAVVTPNTKYEYDALYRLVRADGREHAGQTAQRDQSDPPYLNVPHANDPQAMRRYAEQYEYDAVGNILKMIHQANGGNWTQHYAYAADSNRLSSTSWPSDDPPGPYSARYAYDAHGSLIQMPHLPEMQWDFKDQLQQVELGGGGAAYYVYDAAGQRVRKVHEHNGSTVEERIYLGSYEVYRKRTAGSLTLERETLHILDGQQRIALVETKTVDAAAPVISLNLLSRYQLNNHLGSACLEVDGAGQVISYEEYYPFGTTAYHAARSDVEVSSKRYRYTGKEKDEETGLYYHGARYYACWLGRWTTSDPSGLSDGINLYRFNRNNPIRFLDPNGRGVFDQMSNIAYGVGGAVSNKVQSAYQGVTTLASNVYNDPAGTAITMATESLPGKVLTGDFSGAWNDVWEEGAYAAANVGNLLKSGVGVYQAEYIYTLLTGNQQEIQAATEQAIDDYAGMIDTASDIVTLGTKTALKVATKKSILNVASAAAVGAVVPGSKKPPIHVVPGPNQVMIRPIGAVADRPTVLVQIGEEQKLAAKRTGRGGPSTGAQPGDWEFFEGWLESDMPGVLPEGWFNKSRTARSAGSETNWFGDFIPAGLDRWGTLENYVLHETLLEFEPAFLDNLPKMDWRDARETARGFGYEQPFHTVEELYDR
ncbi:MAG TPA: SpvB/TcaC N-terminal domain-containing protein [Anaerolineae bacterium]|nr:SpvB/TcaC N-terminal domain-containing protein [Anaerolineae bacterium]